MLAGTACTTQPGFGGTPTHTYRIHGLAFDGTAEPLEQFKGLPDHIPDATKMVADHSGDANQMVPEAAEPGTGIEPASPSRDGALPLDEPGPVEPSVAAAEAPLPVSDLIASYDWPVDEALAVMQTESGGDPYAVNPSSGACGLFQLLPCTCIDPECNVAQAYAKWLAGGRSFWAAWYQWWG